MKKFLVIIFLIISNIIFSQNKVIVPTSGTIVFVKEEKIFDKDLFIKSFKDLMPQMKAKMKEEIFIERLADGKKTDTILLNAEVDKMIQNFEMMLPFMIDEPNQRIKIHHEFNKDIITKFYTINDLQNNKIYINRVSNEVKNENDEYVEIEDNKIINLFEYKNETKSINGFTCFKVVYSFDEILTSDLDYFDVLFTSKKREMWVTDKIKCDYHPILNEKEIIGKYYPLEIIEIPLEIKGTFTLYKIETLNIK